MLEVLYFASVREVVGMDAERVNPPAGVDTVAALVDWLARRDPAHGSALADRAALRAALDQRLVAFDAPLGAARELALFPPVTGG